MLNIIRSIWTLCFLVGAFNHARDIFYGGWLPYTYVNLPINLYWTALLPLDLLAALLVWTAPRTGAYLGSFIMISDVAINSWVVWGAGYGPLSEALFLQGIFLLFVLATFRKVTKAPFFAFCATSPRQGELR
jgi:hypothetical protein